MKRDGLGMAMLAAVCVALAGCGSMPRGENPEFTVYDPKDQRIRDRYGTITGNDGITLFSTSGSKRAGLGGEEEGAGSGGIGVNAYLWRGSLETLDFIPLASADPFGGLIITDWYQPANMPNERLKVHVLILDRALRADAVKVSVFRQERQGQAWVDSTVDPNTARGIEDRILTRARQLRIASAEATG